MIINVCDQSNSRQKYLFPTFILITAHKTIWKENLSHPDKGK